jgi:hypothetical protein
MIFVYVEILIMNDFWETCLLKIFILLFRYLKLVDINLYSSLIMDKVAYLNLKCDYVCFT